MGHLFRESGPLIIRSLNIEHGGLSGRRDSSQAAESSGKKSRLTQRELAVISLGRANCFLRDGAGLGEDDRTVSAGRRKECWE